MKQATAAYPFSKTAVDRLALKLADWAARATTRQCCVAREDASSELAPWPGASRWSPSPRLQESSLCDPLVPSPATAGPFFALREPARARPASAVAASRPISASSLWLSLRRINNIAATQQRDPAGLPPYQRGAAGTPAAKAQHAKMRSRHDNHPAVCRTIATHPTARKAPCLLPANSPAACPLSTTRSSSARE